MLLVDQPVSSRAPVVAPRVRLRLIPDAPASTTCRWIVCGDGRSWLCGDPVVERRYCAEHCGRPRLARRTAA